jgi:hypothetical protein
VPKGLNANTPFRVRNRKRDSAISELQEGWREPCAQDVDSICGIENRAGHEIDGIATGANKLARTESVADSNSIAEYAR